jgi:hypothetical protein
VLEERRWARRGIRTYLEPAEQIVSGAVDVQFSAQLFDLVKGETLILVPIGAFPVLFLPDSLALFDVSEPGHELQSVCMEAAKSGVPHAEDVVRGRNEVEDLVVAIEDVDEGEPKGLVLLGELEMVAVEAGGGPWADFLDVLDGNWGTG